MLQRATTSLSLKQAAEQTGVARSTIWRAIKSGKISAARSGAKDYLIDPAELFRVFAPQQPAQQDLKQDATQSATSETALLRNEMEHLRAIRAMLEKQIEDLKADRDSWKHQAERLAPVPTVPFSTRLLTFIFRDKAS